MTAKSQASHARLNPAEREKRILALAKMIETGGVKRATLVKWCYKKWQIKARTARTWIQKANDRVIAEYEGNYSLDRAKMLAKVGRAQRKILENLTKGDLTTTTRSRLYRPRPGADLKTSQIEKIVAEKKPNLSVGLMNGLIKLLDQEARLQGLHQPELHDDSGEKFDILEIEVGVDPNSGIDADGNADAGDGDGN